MAVASAGPYYANNLHLAPLGTDNYTSTLSINIYRPGALPDAQPTVSKALKAQLVVLYVIKRR